MRRRRAAVAARPTRHPSAPDVTPRGRLVALSTSTKNALAARFGPTWRAKTTEELAAEPALAEVLGPELLGELIEFLDRIDRLKFAPERPNHFGRSLEEELADWDPRVAGLIARIEARTNGRHDKQASRSARLLRQPLNRSTAGSAVRHHSLRQLAPGEANPKHVRAIRPDSQPDPPGHLLGKRSSVTGSLATRVSTLSPGFRTGNSWPRISHSLSTASG